MSGQGGVLGASLILQDDIDAGVYQETSELVETVIAANRFINKKLKSHLYSLKFWVFKTYFRLYTVL